MTDASAHPPYWSQYASRDRVGEFLDRPGLLTGDARHAEFGFADAVQYAEWAPRLCGIACVQMVLAHYGLGGGQSTAQLTDGAVAAGAYGSTGWQYAPLLEYARTLGLDGAVRAPYELPQLAADLAAGGHPIASVHPRVMRGELDAVPTGEGGGHLVLILAAGPADSADAAPRTITLHNPNGRDRAGQEAVTVTGTYFAAAFAGRGLALWPADGRDAAN